MGHSTPHQEERDTLPSTVAYDLSLGIHKLINQQSGLVFTRPAI